MMPVPAIAVRNTRNAAEKMPDLIVGKKGAHLQPEMSSFFAANVMKNMFFKIIKIFRKIC